MATTPTFENKDDKQVVPLWINGKNLAVGSGPLIEVIKPSEDKTVHYAKSASVDDAKAAITAASEAFKTWSTTPLEHRRKLLLKVADVLTQRAKEIGDIQIQETSAPPQFGQNFAYAAAATVEELAAQITTAFEANAPHTNSNSHVVGYRTPIGPVLFISPWNSPSYLATRGIATALAAGCTVVLKASELCPATYHMICQVFADAGIPEGVLNQIVVRREDAATVTEAIIADPRIRKVEFIGSAAVGKIIGQLCGKYLKPILMELGGKCPVIICEDADLAKAAKAAAFGAFLHHGQICMSTERIIVVKSVAEEFTNLLKAEVAGWSQMSGYAASKEFASKAHLALEEARKEGAEFIVGDNSFRDEHKTSLTPTIVTGVSPNSKLYDEETFGPSSSLYVVENEEAGLELANSSKYGLVGGVWAKDVMRGIALCKRLECGIVTVNQGTMLTEIPPNASAGAAKGSGWGLSGGAEGIREFLHLKGIIATA
uniref:Aldehyde dehydrogenase domain-containing protein n=1 Tax=Bionectria ochroleuca TaxID=29856 RepID=A0A8H7TK44_BIOOC